jgi:hypothetical protein
MNRRRKMKNARRQNGSVVGRSCLWLPDCRHQRIRVGVRVALLRSIPHQGSQPLSALQVLCEELSCNYLALMSTTPECRVVADKLISVCRLRAVAAPPLLRSFGARRDKACRSVGP